MARGNRKVKEDVKEENVTVDTVSARAICPQLHFTTLFDSASKNVEGFYRDDVDKFHDEKEKVGPQFFLDLR